MFNHELSLFEVRTRSEETTRRATLGAALGPARLRLFARRVVRLSETVEVRHPVSRDGKAAINQRVRQLANSDTH